MPSFLYRPDSVRCFASVEGHSTPPSCKPFRSNRTVLHAAGLAPMPCGMGADLPTGFAPRARSLSPRAPTAGTGAARQSDAAAAAALQIPGLDRPTFISNTKQEAASWL